MLTITGRNVNDIFPVTVFYLNELGVRQESRNGPTLEIPEPVSIRYLHLCENVLFDPVRDANPILHFFDALWMLSGRNDAKFLTTILPRFVDYSDDQVTFAGAYGYRMRNRVDQIKQVIENLKKDPDDRRNVLMLRVPEDVNYHGKDSCCNVAVALRIRSGKLCQQVFNRSNDAILGALGANVVQFSFLQEYMAGHIGCGIGDYHQTTNCLHAYIDTPQWEASKTIPLTVDDPYAEGIVNHFPMMGDPEGFDWDLTKFFETFDLKAMLQNPDTYCTKYFRCVVIPMWNTFLMHRQDDSGLSIVDCVEASDWRLATKNWLLKREEQK